MVNFYSSVKEDGDTWSGPVARGVGPLQLVATFNATPHFVHDGLPTTETDLVGTSIRGKPVLGLGANVPGTVNWQLDAGVAITPTKGVITYSFADAAHITGIYNNPKEGFVEGAGYSPFSEAQRTAGRIAINLWDELIPQTFKEVNGTGGADIVMANTDTGPAQAWAYYPYNYGVQKYNHFMSDAWIHTPASNASNGQLYAGGYGLLTLEHELGHTLGLSHPGDYNYGDDNDGDGQPDPIGYANDAFYYQDSRQYSIMSYFDSYETGAQWVDWNLMRFVYSSTPMVHDIAVIQAKYGVDTTTRTGNTTYGFNATADVTNDAMRFNNHEMLSAFTIWDAGGIDTLDLSGYNTPSIIDLRPGSYSSAGGAGHQLTLAEINANNAAAGFGNRTAALYDYYFKGVAGVNEGLSWKQITGTTSDFVMHDNIGIAYGAIVENAIGGGGNDRINGNSAANVLTGNGGSDTFIFAKDGSVDTIKDFAHGVDHIDLTSIDANGAAAGDQAFTFLGTAAFTGHAGELRQSGDYIYGDTNGDGVQDFAIKLDNHAVVTASDFLL